MDGHLPVFPPFDPELDKADVAARWKKWLSRLENLFVAMNIQDDKRKRALLLHYAGEQVHDIFDAERSAYMTSTSTRSTSTSTTSTSTSTTDTSSSSTADAPHSPDCSTFDGAKKILDTYFAPKRNVQMEIYVFRSCKQKPDQTLEAYVTELRRLALTCSFPDTEQEILSQVIQHCSSQRLRRQALRNPDKNLNEIIILGRMLEQADQQARAMERDEVNAFPRQTRPPPVQMHHAKRHSTCTLPNRTGNMKTQAHKASNRSTSTTCGNCGGRYPHDGQCPAAGKICNACQKPNHFAAVCRSKTCRNCGGRYPHDGPCPAAGKTCKSCHKMNHFDAVCRSKARAKQQLNVVEDTDPTNPTQSDDNDDYCFPVSSGPSISAVSPKTELYVQDVPVNFLIDTGASVNILDESTYERLGKPPFRDTRLSPLFPYGGTTPIQVLGSCCLPTHLAGREAVPVDYHVVAGSHGCLLGYDTASSLHLVHVVREISDWQKAFPKLSQGIGKLKGRTFELHIDKDVQPVAITNRRTPFHLRKKVEDELTKLLKEDIIEEVNGEPTPWVSPIVTPPKKDGSIRLCVDMREPNKAIQRERHCMPTTDELIQDLNGATVFSKIDLKAGYHQLELAPQSRYITTFATHKGLYRYKRLNFGICSASEIFQHAIHEVIRDVKGVKNISDDIICFGRGPNAQADHDRAVKETLTKLQDSGLTVNWPKCEFGVKQIEFFGLVFSAKGVSPDPKKVQAVHNTDPPTNASQVRSFLGMLTYSARFIQDFATISEPLRKLTVKDAQWVWGPEQSTAFNTLKDRLTDSTTIAYYDPHAPIEVLTDASPVGLGAILAQNSKVVAYASRALSDVESRYSQTEREALAVVWACEHFDIYLRGATSFDVITDHKPLVTIWAKPRPPLRIERWGLRLQPYKMVIKYRPGRDNPADFMSRHPIARSEKSLSQDFAEQYVHFIATTSTPKALSLTEIADESSKDHTLMKAIDLLQSGRWHEIAHLDDPNIDKRELLEYKNVKDELTFHTAGILLRGTLIVVPASLRDRVVALAHESHQGMSRTKALLRSKVWFPGINAAVESMIKRCVICQAVQDMPTPLEPLRMSPMPPGPWQHVSMDFCGPLPSGEYLLVLVDEYSRYPIVEIVRSVSAAAVLPVLDKVLSMFGFPKILKSDNGSPFNSAQFAQYAKHCGFVHRRITPHWPRANSQAESFNKPLMKSIRAAHLEGKNWKQEMFAFLRQYRCTPHTSTSVSPHRLLFGRDPITRLPQMSEVVDHHHKDSPASSVHEHATNRDAVAKQKQKSYADKRNNARIRSLDIGDHVMLRRDSRGNKLTSTFHPFSMTVVARKGNMITAKGKNHVVTRNISFFKRVPIDDTSRDTDDRLSNDVDDDDSAMPSMQHIPNPPTAAYQPPPQRRTRRHRRPPKYLKDYVTNVITQ